MRAKAWEKNRQQRRKYFCIKNMGKSRKADQEMRAKAWENAGYKSQEMV